ncbi:MAG: hypothetical protein RMI89_02540 [Gloeomargarita sp. SKYBB_i_bin120]|nr:hypothetical protein [Gloeomargarita sp. SKYG98]MCS7291838.1 hypothetical protein [Gloeomargarita sp. SKYB120]MDW8177398.1 hypothetical protein [Gloeomargarita sp. SKYBB_i_bin120]
MKDFLPEESWEAQADALVEEVFAQLETPLPPERRLPPTRESFAIAPVSREPGPMVVLTYRPQPPQPVEPILTAAFVETPEQREWPWWLWLGLGLVVMLGAWSWQRHWHARPIVTQPEPAHTEFIAYLDRALDHIPEAPPSPAPKPAPKVRSLPPPPPPVTVAPLPQPPVALRTPSAPSLPRSPVSPVVSPSPSPTPERPTMTLVGLLQMGPQSTALFQIGDTTQNVTIGGLVGATGWRLQEVREREVVLVKGNQNRVLLVGQTLSD